RGRTRRCRGRRGGRGGGGSHRGRGGRGGGRVGLDGAPLVPDWPGVRDQTGRAVAGGCRLAADLRGVAGSGLVFHPALHKVCRLVYNIGIDRASLLRRIELDTRTRTERKVELTVESLVAVGGRAGKRGARHRRYF